MAEFTQRAKNKRILRSIDTKKSSTKEVYEFYRKWKKQAGLKGAALPKNAKKADIIRELHHLEAHQHASLQAASKAATEKKIKTEFETIRAAARKVENAADQQRFMQRAEKFNKKLESLQKSGKIGREFKPFSATTEEAKPRKKHPDITSTSRAPKQKRNNIYYKGSVAHDYIKKMCDDGLLDTDDFDDSKEIWQAIDDIEENPQDYQFFLDNYSGKHKKGSREFYYEFLDTLQMFEKFEEDMKNNKQPIPEPYTPEYWQAVERWKHKI